MIKLELTEKELKNIHKALLERYLNIERKGGDVLFAESLKKIDNNIYDILERLEREKKVKEVQKNIPLPEESI